jgi:hypothetical protein
MVMLHGHHAAADSVRGSDQNVWVIFGKQKWKVLASAEAEMGDMTEMGEAYSHRRMSLESRFIF